LIDAETLDFEVQVDGFVSTGGLGGPAILPLSLAKKSQLTQAFPDRTLSGICGISPFEHALNYFLLGCVRGQVCTAAMLDHAIGPNVIKDLKQGLARFLETHADRGWKQLDDFVGLRRDRVVSQSKIRRPDEKDYRGGYDAEGYAEPVTTPESARGPAPRRRSRASSSTPGSRSPTSARRAGSPPARFGFRPPSPGGRRRPPPAPSPSPGA